MIDLVAIITDLVHCHSGSYYEHIKHRYIKFQSDNVNDGRVIAGGISTTLLPVKYSRVVVASLYCGVRFLLYMVAW